MLSSAQTWISYKKANFLYIVVHHKGKIMKKMFAFALAFTLAGLGFNAAAQSFTESMVNTGFNMSASGWQGVSGSTIATGSLNFGTPINSFLQNGTGSVSVGMSPFANGSTSIGVGGGSAGVGFNFSGSVSAMAGITSWGDQGSSVNMSKSMTGYANSTGNGSASITFGADAWANGMFIPPVVPVPIGNSFPR